MEIAQLRRGQGPRLAEPAPVLGLVEVQLLELIELLLEFVPARLQGDAGRLLGGNGQVVNGA